MKVDMNLRTTVCAPGSKWTWFWKGPSNEFYSSQGSLTSWSRVFSFAAGNAIECQGKSPQHLRARWLCWQPCDVSSSVLMDSTGCLWSANIPVMTDGAGKEWLFNNSAFPWNVLAANKEWGRGWIWHVLGLHGGQNIFLDTVLSHVSFKMQLKPLQ